MTSLDPASAAGLADYAGDWVLDPAATTITFRTKAMWVLPVKGTAKAVRGGATVAADGTVRGELVIDAASIDTGTKKRDEHLRTADFFDTATHPTMDFNVTGARTTGPGRVALDGQLTISGQTRPVVLEAGVATEGDRLTLTGTIDDLDRSEWGITWSKMGAGLHNRVVIRAHFNRG